MGTMWHVKAPDPAPPPGSRPRPGRFGRWGRTRLATSVHRRFRVQRRDETGSPARLMVASLC